MRFPVWLVEGRWPCLRRMNRVATLSLLTPLSAISWFPDFTEEDEVGGALASPSPTWCGPHRLWKVGYGSVYSVTRPITAVVTRAQVTWLCIFVLKALR